MRSGGSALATFAGLALIVVAALLLYTAIAMNAAPRADNGPAPVAGGGVPPALLQSGPAAYATAAPAGPAVTGPSSTPAQQGVPSAPGSSAPVPSAASPVPTAAPAGRGGPAPAKAVAPVTTTPPAHAAPPRPHSGPATRGVIWNALRAAGYSPVQAAGVMGNMQNESAFNVETNWPDTNGFHAYGLISWNAAFYPDAPSLVTGDGQADLARQVQYLLQHTRRVAKGLRGSTPAEVASNWSDYVEACAGCAFGGYQNSRRQAIAVVIYQQAISGGWG